MSKKADAHEKVYDYILRGQPGEALAAAQALQTLGEINSSKLATFKDDDAED